MTRVKKGVHALKRRRSVLKQTKGMRHGRSTKERQAKEALLHAGNYSFAHRKDKKSHNRKLWNIKINAGARELGMSYSRFIDSLKKKSIMLDRKILSDLAEHHPKTFAKVMEAVK
ncbi:50S ribosomal protein L20 [Candidatus Nomurabacteria bacterium RIFCSPHIGHO2_01_FULL_41_91]|uniref:Large ribosomal subunit protein bL20 n=1 Tax=Candidatus Nomurabacteria bacterium RIFCSPLOWO2_12_FULL_41_10 TaxID=1801795 RepID=A0A1F6YB14_9BACT|nr:MAG: 50S ribosomal protein L20 [Candidatus Nomurabacteria bacterium RIFCSPHIGHO2_01_FULL_41_91]OGI80251.1 MAG: 50S ribosomal protein L20 [Candidatus Nomurabacteria bacterium RIFCSPHIGHO2_02_FULL_41_52]OGI85015.1 MAG: 50S ribosomal protein L20 [Candidatus Nomurabacteria bacterium RIFCSPHIGHO2_12_FULL_42_19]OGI94297.1 MAG: 50S ribosomal protein L20 [Candidatus Nomurabacteria bacterium RIFCSPLOWO2_01_FULL_41_52]OGI97945.1 MAG: 50S ribosomal protein L20 [Candidatus Nomurabacteria bacterium RIFCS